MEADDFILEGGRLVLPDRVETGLSVVVRGGLVEALVRAGEEPSGPRRLDAGGALVTPGLFEFHLHGCGGIGLDDLGADPAEGAARLGEMRAFLRGRGVTGFLPTLVAAPRALEALALALEAAGLPDEELPGIYLEGPFIAASRRGGIPAETISAPDPVLLAELLAAARGRLRVMTVAPELPGIGAVVEALREAGVLVSLGHSDCRIEELGLPGPPFSITHLWNAMSGFSHREAGLAALPFVDRRPFVELNADGVHVGESALRACLSALDPGRLILVSDAVVAAGLPPGEYLYHGRRVLAAGAGVRYADTGVLMGSERILPEVLGRWTSLVGAGLPQALRAAALNPRQALAEAAATRGGGSWREALPARGAILPGMEADLAVWDSPFSALRELLGPSRAAAAAPYSPER